MCPRGCQAAIDLARTLEKQEKPFRANFRPQAFTDTRICPHCGRQFQAGSQWNKTYCGRCEDPVKLARFYWRQRNLERAREYQKRWLKKAQYDPAYRLRKAESQRKWREKNKARWDGAPGGDHAQTD